MLQSLHRVLEPLAEDLEEGGLALGVVVEQLIKDVVDVRVGGGTLEDLLQVRS
jgi:hypothetical protein